MKPSRVGNGYKPTAVRVAIDALAVYVHKDNPISAINIPQLDAVFSVTRRCGRGADALTWGDLGLRGNWQTRRIQLYGRNSVSGTYGYFKQVALCSGDFKATVNEQPGSASVVQAVGASLNGIGYSGIGYQTSDVKVLPLALDDGNTPIEAAAVPAISGDYPLARYLYIYINKRPDTPLPATGARVPAHGAFERRPTDRSEGRLRATPRPNRSTRTPTLMIRWLVERSVP